MKADYQQKKVWVQRDGTPIKVKDMGDQHLLNTIRMLRRAAGLIYGREVISRYLYATPPGGDMANDMFDHEFDRALEREPWDWLKQTPLVKAMRKELKRRRAVVPALPVCAHGEPIYNAPFCDRCSNELLDSLVPSGGPGD